MKILIRFGGLLAVLLMCTSAFAGDIKVEGAWARATAPGQDSAAVDMTLTSKQDATLVGASSPIARSSTLHSMKNMDGMMKMREVDMIELPAGKAVNLGENGYHLMLEGLKAPLKEGGSVPLTLSIKSGTQGVVRVDTKAEVRSLTATQAPMQGNVHMNMPMD